MGKMLRVTALFDDVQKANHHMETHSDQGLVAEIGGLLILANLYDKGTKVCIDQL